MTREQEIIYAAGLFDGEGCCGVYAEGRKHCFIRVQVAMCTPQAPQLFARLFGGHVKACTYRRKKSAGGYYEAAYYLPVYSWIVTADIAANALQELLPWLREKRPQAELVLEARAIQKRRPRGQGAAYSADDLARIVDIRDRVKSLKRVG